MEQYPILVIATEEHRGHVYAQELGLQNYVVKTEVGKIEGLRARALVVTPEYLWYNGDESVRYLDEFIAGFRTTLLTSSRGIGYPTELEKNNG